MAAIQKLVGIVGRTGRRFLSSQKISYVDSHTEGEPTRVILSGAPTLSSGRMIDQREHLRQNDWFRQCIQSEPRGWETLVSGVLFEPTDASSTAGVVFMNNVGYLGMCGHGMIGLAVTLHYLGRIPLGTQTIETPVGSVQIELLDPNRVAVENVPSYRYRKQVPLDVEGLGTIHGDIAWGGNWFFLTEVDGIELIPSNRHLLTQVASKIRQELEANGITGAEGAEIDHIELMSGGRTSGADGRNFVYCPGGAFDRSPCGTGTSAKLACLADDGQLAEEQTWVQESVIGSRFETSFRRGPDGTILPRIVGRAYICGEGNLIRQPTDPFANGIPFD